MISGTDPYPLLLLIVVPGVAIAAILIGGLYLLRQRKSTRDPGVKRDAYLSFIRNTRRESHPLLWEWFEAGSKVGRVSTDGQIQMAEDRFDDLLSDHGRQILHEKLQDELTAVVSYGSEQVKRLAADLLDATSLRFRRIDLGVYSEEFQEFYRKWWKIQKEGIVYGFEAMVSPEERFLFIILSRMYSNLVETMRMELWRFPWPRAWLLDIRKRDVMVESQSRKVSRIHAMVFACVALIEYLILRLMAYGLNSADKYRIDLKSLSISSVRYYLFMAVYIILVIAIIAFAVGFSATLYLTIRSIIFLILGSRLDKYWLRVLFVIWIICLITAIIYSIISHNYIYISSSIVGFCILGYGIYELEKYYHESFFDK